MTTVGLLARQIIPLLAAVFCVTAVLARAQEEEPPAVKQYREDYERYQQIAAVTDSLKRGEQIIQFMKERPKANAKLQETAQANLFGVLDAYIKAENNEPLLSLSERYIKIRPKVGQTYYCYGFALKNLKRYDEAMLALAKCFIIKNPLSTKAKDFLDLVYKSQHRGNLAGEEQIIAKARLEVAQIS
jgi:tetratricopeptide (TPR) repeat protein